MTNKPATAAAPAKLGKVGPKRAVAQPSFEIRAAAIETALRDLASALAQTPPASGGYDEMLRTWAAKHGAVGL